MITSTFILFFIDYLIYLLLIFYLNYFISRLLKFFIINIFGVDLWTFVDDSFRDCPNNNYYDNLTDTYILDYEYFEISEMIYYHDNFFDPTLELIFHFDLLHETRTREDDEHELFGFVSTYIIPLQYKYYILEHYWPSDESGNILIKNFYDFNDLLYEFTFFSEEYDNLWQNYELHRHSKTTFYKDHLYETQILQSFAYNKFEYKYFKFPISQSIVINEDKNLFLKKKNRTFDHIEPSQEMCIKQYMTWFSLKTEYDKYISEYKVFCNLSPYEYFDHKYYDIRLSKLYNLIDCRTKRSQHIESIDEYFLDYVNSSNLTNYYLKSGIFIDFKKQTINEVDYDQQIEPFDYIYFFFHERGLLMYIYLLIIFYFLCLVFLVLTCWLCFNYYDYSFDFDLHFSYIRALTRNKNYNDYNDYKFLIFNSYYSENDITTFFSEKQEKNRFFYNFKYVKKKTQFF